MGWRIPEEWWRKGPWNPEEDRLLIEYVNLHGDGRWSSVSRCPGLNRSGKSCRLRWVNYLRPGLRRGQITPQEEGIIIELHALWGNKWSTIARYLPGRTDNEIKNYWRTNSKKKEKFSQKQEKRKAQIVKQEDEHQQHLQQLQQQQQLEAGDMKVVNTNIAHEKMHEAAETICPTLEDQSLPVMSQDAVLWGGLWNLDDLP